MKKIFNGLLTGVLIASSFSLSTYVCASASSQEGSGPATSASASFSCPAIKPDHPLVTLLRKGTLPREYTFVQDAVTWTVINSSGHMSMLGLEPSGRNPHLSKKDLVGEILNTTPPECSYDFSANAFFGGAEIDLYDFSFSLVRTDDYRKDKKTSLRRKVR